MNQLSFCQQIIQQNPDTKENSHAYSFISQQRLPFGKMLGVFCVCLLFFFLPYQMNKS